MSQNPPENVPEVASHALFGVWTSEKPTLPGWYWVRSLPKYTEQIIRFEESSGERAGQIEPITGALSTYGWKEFCGPIPPPNV